MENKKPLSGELEPSYFQLQAYWGATKHMGGLKATNEYVRVTKLGGYVGLNEGTWIKTPPPLKLVEYMSGIFGTEAEFLTSQEWEKLLETSGLKDITVRTYKINLPKEFIYRVIQLDLKDFSRALYRFLALYITSPAFRRTIKKRYTRGMPIRAFIEYLGYGIYVGRK